MIQDGYVKELSVSFLRQGEHDHDAKVLDKDDATTHGGAKEQYQIKILLQSGMFVHLVAHKCEAG